MFSNDERIFTDESLADPRVMNSLWRVLGKHLQKPEGNFEVADRMMRELISAQLQGINIFEVGVRAKTSEEGE